MENGHVMLLGEIIKRFDYLLDKDSEVIKVLITSSSKISDGEVQRISTNIENNIQKKVNITTETDASIIGGLKLRVGNTLIDGSIYSRLQKIRETLIQV
jgi:F-type H+-transporting ATPase subunit delta